MAAKLERLKNYWLDHPGLGFILFATFIFFIRLVLRNPLLELDEAEQVVMAQQLLPGYPNQPPLYSWLQYLFFKTFGVHLFSLALLKSVLLFGCFYSFHRICRLHCQNQLLAWCATLGWAFIPAISLDLIRDNTHSVLALLSASLTWYWFIAPSRLTKTAWYLIFGCLIGLGLLSKFNYLLFLFILLISALSLDEQRAKILQPQMLLALILALFIASPYFIWLCQHPALGLQSSYKLVPEHKPYGQGGIELLKDSFFFAGPILIISALFFPLQNYFGVPRFKTQTTLNRLLLRYHLLSLPLLISIVLIAGLRDFETRWLIPVLFLCPLLHFSQIEPKQSFSLRTRFFIILCLLIQLVLLSIITYKSYAPPKSLNRFLITQISQTLREESSFDYLVSDSYWLLGNLMPHLPPTNSRLLTPQTKTKLPPGKAALVWQGNPFPYWVHDLVTQYGFKVELIEDTKNHSVIARYARIYVK